MGWLKDAIEAGLKIVPEYIRDRRDKKTLRKMLENKEYPDGRNIEILESAIGRDRETTRRLLGEIGARRVILQPGDSRELWTLRPLR